jgi:5-methylcytosine-specific restriction endonuclease McrA
MARHRAVTGMRCFSTHERRKMRIALLKKYGAVCQLCNPDSTKNSRIDLTLDTHHPRAFSIDHIIALADGGTNTLDNMWPAHRQCNTRKGSVSGGSSKRNPVNINGNRLAYSSVSA